MEHTQLTINDLATIRNIIDLAVSRGAFRANEVRVVGETYERLEAFLVTLEQTDHPESESQLHDHQDHAHNAPKGETL
jgi:hypothetical protein